VTDGIGYIARRGQVHEIRPGDVIYIEPGESTGTAPHRTGSWHTSPSSKQTTTGRS